MRVDDIALRLADLPVYRRRERELPAAAFNPIRLGLLRLKHPQRIRLQQLRGLDMILSVDLWVCVDRELNDIPVIAWSEFAIASRDNLTAPVICLERQYHQHAGVIIDPLLAQVGSALSARTV